MAKRALLPGTFNPPTLGHKDLITRGSELSDYFYVGIGQNPEKNDDLFSVSEREAMLKEITKKLSNVEIVCFSGLVVDFVQENKIDFIIRGLRDVSDFEFETKMAFANRKMSGVETVYITSDQQYLHINSTFIKQIGERGRRLHDFVPEEIEDIVFQRLSNQD